MACTLSAGQTMTGLALNAITSARANSIALTVPSISGTLWGSSTKPTKMYTRSFSLIESHSTCAACIVSGSPVKARLPAYKMRQTP